MASKSESTGVQLYIPGIIVLLMFTIGLSTTIFAPIWFLNDAGIVYSNKEEVAATGQPVEVRTVDGRYVDFLRGYAGIGVVLSYVQLLLAYFDAFGGLGALTDPILIILNLVFFLGLPIFMLVASIPLLIVLDRIRDRRIRFARNDAHDMGISTFVNVRFEEADP